MALDRPSRECSFCREKIHFIHNRPSELQKMMGFYGDLGGFYENHRCKEEEAHWKKWRKEARKSMTKEELKSINDLLKK